MGAEVLATITVAAPGRGTWTVDVDRTPFVIGRDDACDLVLDYPFISRRQIVLERGEAGWRVRSEGRNPVTADGTPLQGTRAISSGVRLGMGPISAAFSVSTGAPDDALDAASVTMELSLHELLGAREAGRHLATLAELSGALLASQDPGSSAEHAARAAREALAARAACVIDRDAVAATAGAPVRRVSRALIRRAIESRAVLAVEDARMLPGLEDSASITGHAGRPLLLAPLGPPSSGVVYVERDEGAPAFREDELAFLAVLAHLTGAGLDAARVSRSAVEQRASLLRDVERRGGFGALIGDSPAMKRVATAITKVAPSDTTVLVTGETGTGKELVARELHARSTRSDAPFFALNCAALPETLIESELFGHRRGAFSGADRDRPGIFELAAGGTVFLDEIGELPLVAQAKILRVLDAKEIQPLGGGMPVKIDTRVVAATHRDLKAEVAAGRFRQDLLYRLEVFSIVLPPLRERRGDLRALIASFLARNTEAKRKRLLPPTEEALAALESYDYPGNVRQLAHLIEQAAVLAEDGEAIDLAHLPDEIARSTTAPAAPAARDAANAPVSLRAALADFERAFLTRELERDGWNRTATAQRLQVPLRTFMDRLKRLDIRGPGR